MDKKILIWFQHRKIIKAFIDYEYKRIHFYDENDNCLLVRRGLTIQELRRVEQQIEKNGFSKKLRAFSPGFFFDL